MGLEHEAFHAIDVEGNGGQPPEIIELAIAPIVDLQLGARRWEWRVQPKEPIAPSATRIHGITDDDVVDAPSIEDIAPDIMTWTDKRRIIGHNVRVELEIISRSIPDWKPSMAVDTLRLAKTIRPGLASYGLESLGQATGLAAEAERLTGRRHHSALFDTVLTALLFIELITSVSEEDREGVLMDADILDKRQGTLF
jgi:DNA polymerase III subunit epsilon